MVYTGVYILRLQMSGWTQSWNSYKRTVSRRF